MGGLVGICTPIEIQRATGRNCATFDSNYNVNTPKTLDSRRLDPGLDSQPLTPLQWPTNSFFVTKKTLLLDGLEGHFQ